MLSWYMSGMWMLFGLYAGLWWSRVSVVWSKDVFGVDVSRKTVRSWLVFFQSSRVANGHSCFLAVRAVSCATLTGSLGSK